MSWNETLKTAVSTITDLCDVLNIQSADLPVDLDPQFPLRVPYPFIKRMEKGNPQDPLLLQVLPQLQELQQQIGFSKDPLHEFKSTSIPGLLHKYHGRVLITLTGSCAINCRYCFRRHFPYADNSGLQYWQQILDYIKADDSIHEIIFSGGDPMLVDDTRLQVLINDLEKISHISTLRIHTRLPVVIPERVTNTLVELLAQIRLQAVVVFHINHPNEIDDDFKERMSLFKNVTLLNQSVLLKNINDSVAVLARLSKELFSCHILPYYLHALDPVAGAAHFAVNEEQMLAIHANLQTQLPGYLVPKLVREVAELPNKKLLY